MTATTKTRRNYVLQDGTKVPGATTIIGDGLGWGKQPLMYWAWKEGQAGRDFRQTRDAAASAGTLGHDVIEARTLGRDVDEVLARAVDDEQRVKAERALEAFLSWTDGRQVAPLFTELPLVSERHRFGGTIDLIARVGDVLALVDLKTGKGIYDEAVIQLAAYRELWRERRDEKLDDVIILHVSSVTAEFAAHRLTEKQLDAAWRAFLALRSLYDLKRDVEVARGAA